MSTPSPLARTAQTLALTFMSVVVGLGVVIALTVPEADLSLPPAYVIGGQLVAGVAVALLCTSIGFRAAPITPGTPSEKATVEGLQKHQTSMFLRLALSEVVALVSLALAFALSEGQLMTYVIGGAVSLALMGFFAYPSARNVRRIEAALDSSGARSGLSAAFGLGNGPAGTHQTL
ncbi:hypothetical protein FB381_1862 [Nocardioides albertanoniae]|uniref:Uncharacterized protein n=1 Tax=Nocardioides albertanoniae TaxID=1175486 RepID=A0A543A5U4_9ACTN|nr:hypothetical protein [Nocardioides albertanoniae]TQL67973.1 hypothetical protein FB381_1862 [Nocardioides albertanoniae]